MAEKHSFLDRIRCDEATIAKINQASREAARKQPKSNHTDNGGRERGDEGPGSLGREPGNKVGAIRASLKAPAVQSAPGQAGHTAASSGKGTASPGGKSASSGGKAGTGQGGNSGAHGGGNSGGHGGSPGGGSGGHGGGSGGHGGGSGGHGGH